MKKVFVIKVRVTREQHDKIIGDAQSRGFKTISRYMRHLALEHNLNIEQKINAIYYKLMH